MAFIKRLSRSAGLKYFLVLLSLILIIPFTLLPIISYYVDATNGNDSNNGTSELTPWQTIAKINASKLNSGVRSQPFDSPA
jgi:hypothetical protein